jgi:hypothetical protein
MVLSTTIPTKIVWDEKQASVPVKEAWNPPYDTIDTGKNILHRFDTDAFYTLVKIGS